MADYLALKDLYSGSECNISLGIRPSGKIHLGNLATICLAGLFGKDVGGDATIRLAIVDLDLPDVSDWSVKDNQHVRYFHQLPAPDGSGQSLREYATARIGQFLNGLQELLDVPFELSTLSDIQRDERFRAGLDRALGNAALMEYINPRYVNGKVGAFPLCPDCGTSSPWMPDYHEGVLETVCMNDCCAVEEYDVNVMDCAIDIAPHHIISPLRDATIPPFADVHVYGGDYGETHCGSDPKVAKVKQVTLYASGGNAPRYLVGPMFLAGKGEKMSKSRDNGLSLEVLQERLGAGLVEGVLEITRAVKSCESASYRTVENLFEGIAGEQR